MAVQHKKKSRASGFFFLYSSLFSFPSSLFSKSPARLFRRRDKREERKEKVAFLLRLWPKRKVAQAAFSFLYFSLFSFHSSLFPNSSTRLFQRRDKKEERKEKEAFLLPSKSIKLYLGSNPSIKKVKYLFLSKQQFFK